jgi:hypothetical protein
LDVLAQGFFGHLEHAAAGGGCQEFHLLVLNFRGAQESRLSGNLRRSLSLCHAGAFA